MALLTLFGRPASAQTVDAFREARLHMVREYIEREGVTDSRVLQAMRTVPRHEFMRPQERRWAYYDGAFPIGYKQTISPPFIVAYMTETIDPQPGERVLEIGTGSGYQAAVLSHLAREVYTIEIVPQLGRAAARRLGRLGYDNVEVKVGDGYQGWPEKAPFDKIIVTCSPEKVPQPLVEQLADGGRMIIPLGRRYQQVFYLFEKKDGELERKKLIPTLFVPMTGISEGRRTVKPDPRNPQLVNAGFERDENEDGRVDGWHYQRQVTLVTTGPARRGSPDPAETADRRSPTGESKLEGRTVPSLDAAPEGRRYVRLQNSDPGRHAQLLQGMALDGRHVGELHFRLQVRHTASRSGPERFHQPGLLVHFYDSSRQPIGNALLGGWIGTASRWRAVTGRVRVPVRVREAVVQIGLNGGTGTLEIDDVQMEPRSR